MYCTNGIYKTDLLAMLQPCGRSQVFSTVFHPSVFARRKAAVTKTVKTESCFMSVMIQTVQLAVTSAQTVHLLIYKSVGKVVASTELELKSSRPRTVVMVFELTVALMLIKSLLNTLVRLSLKMSVIDE
jgi:hypothetical protein